MTSALQPPPYLVPSSLIQMDKWRCSLLYQALIDSFQVLTLIQMLIHSVEKIHINADIDSPRTNLPFMKRKLQKHQTLIAGILEGI